ncbi:hypothetical protein AArcSl_1477 [Halalkaliarchaeum desulfuricum]|uniref:Uncharacterized protein n=1 Tax=Halalkaliarchaeum desulfuricum TaxID=2055893 RepID=A0A343TJ34_9EURY|nr:DUF5791 family protein [Halalkaliarchaeum desulfuricum]AUX09106.1 hypothetical protein AArcSl_1477 [Halalkaliarchaeum desulfuricum]
MLYDAVDDPSDRTPRELLAAYRRELSSVVDSVGIEPVAAESGVERATLEALQAGESADLSLEEAAAILATDDRFPGADAVVYELRDHLLMGMSSAVVDVDTIAADIEADLTGQEVQQALEGRTRFTLEQLAEIQAAIERRR